MIIRDLMAQEHENATRWHENRREAYAEFLVANIAAFDWWVNASSGIKVLASLEDQRRLKDDVFSSIAPLNLLSTPEVKDAADQLMNAVIAAIDEGAQRLSSRHLFKPVPVEDETAKNLTDSFVSARIGFERQAKKELGVVSKSNRRWMSRRREPKSEDYLADDR